MGLLSLTACCKGGGLVEDLEQEDKFRSEVTQSDRLDRKVFLI
jgi:hypothetical protein